WRPDAAPNGPRAAANGPRAGANGPRAGANGPRAGAHGPRAGAHGPRAGAYGPRAAARGPRARPKTTLTASQGRFSYPDAQEVRGGVAGVSRFWGCPPELVAWNGITSPRNGSTCSVQARIARRSRAALGLDGASSRPPVRHRG